MTTGYREQALRCPGCAAWLEPTQVDAAMIDACPGCGAIWVDWFDGELPAMARGAPRSAPSGAGRGEFACPRCRIPLTEERYPGSAADLLRCGDCGGAFVPRASLPSLASASPRDEEAPVPIGLGRLIALVRRWLE
jgi:Zn-finger nucleic acid-binding protein